MSTLWAEGYSHNSDHNLFENDFVTPQYFSAMDMPLLAGRFFTDADRAGAPVIYIVNRAFEQKSDIIFPGTPSLALSAM
jgi:hypothetical protein